MNTPTRLLAAALSAACLICAPLPVLVPSAMAAITEAEIGEILQTSKSSNMRRLPDKKSPVIEKLKKGTKVKILDYTGIGENRWAHVRITKNGKEGYILISLLEPVPTPTPTPTPSPTPTPTPVPTPTPTPTPVPTPTPIPTPTPDDSIVAGENVYEENGLGRTTSNVNIRRKPDGNRLTQLDGGEKLTLIGDVNWEGRLWYHVIAEDGMEGYILADYIRTLQPFSLIEVDEETVLDMYPVLSCDPIGDIQLAEPFDYTDEELSQYRSIEVGDRNEAVRKLKLRLYELGYFKKKNNNNLYTDSTSDIIKIFQRDNGLPATGLADPHTQAMLFDDRVLGREGSEAEVGYLDNREAKLRIQRAEIGSYNFHGSVQVSLRNDTGAKLTAFGIKVIPYFRDGTPADMLANFEDEIKREYVMDRISIQDGRSYSDFWEPSEEDDDDDGGDFWEDMELPGEEGNEFADVGAYRWPHHFQISEQIYFSSAQIAVTWYRSGGKKVNLDDDQLIFVGVDYGVGDSLIHTLPIELTESQIQNCEWKMGASTHYVLPVYQQYYQLPQGAWVKSVERNSPLEDAGIEAGDILVGIGDVTILGDATLRKARGSILPGESAPLVFWRDGTYYQTELIRPE